MRIISFTVIFCVSFLFIGYTGKTTGIPVYQQEKNVTFQRIQTYGADTSPKEAMISVVNGMLTDRKNNIYILDKGERILSYKPDGSLRWAVGQKGKGPGDIEFTMGMATDGVKYIYLANQYGSRIDKFDLNGKFISSFNVSLIHEASLVISGFIKPNLLITYKTIRGRVGSEVYVLDTDNNFKIQNRFQIDQTGDANIAPNSSFGIGIGVTDEKIVSGSITDYRLGFYTTQGKIIKELTKKTKKMYFFFYNQNGGGVSGGISVPFKVSGSYYLSVMRGPSNVTEMDQLANNKFKKEFAAVLDIFDEKGNPVFSRKSTGRTDSEIGSPVYSDSEGYLYTSKDLPYPHVCKYKVIIGNN